MFAIIKLSYRRVAVLTGHTAEISNVLYNWDNSLVASSSLDGSARLWDARGRNCIATVTADATEVNLMNLYQNYKVLFLHMKTCTRRYYNINYAFRRNNFRSMYVYK